MPSPSKFETEWSHGSFLPQLKTSVGKLQSTNHQKITKNILSLKKKPNQPLKNSRTDPAVQIFQFSFPSINYQHEFNEKIKPSSFISEAINLIAYTPTHMSSIRTTSFHVSINDHHLERRDIFFFRVDCCQLKYKNSFFKKLKRMPRNRKTWRIFNFLLFVCRWYSPSKHEKRPREEKFIWWSVWPCARMW